ncbi:hypothetical protein GN956_G21406 [Arapaima gigas]
MQSKAMELLQSAETGDVFTERWPSEAGQDPGACITPAIPEASCRERSSRGPWAGLPVCLPRDSTTALNMLVIFNPRRNTAESRPPFPAAMFPLSEEGKPRGAALPGHMLESNHRNGG